MKKSDVACNIIKDEIGEDPGYFFFGDKLDIDQFDNLFRQKKYNLCWKMITSAGVIGMDDIQSIDDLIDYLNEYGPGIDLSITKIKKSDITLMVRKLVARLSKK